MVNRLAGAAQRATAVQLLPTEPSDAIGGSLARTRAPSLRGWRRRSAKALRIASLEKAYGEFEAIRELSFDVGDGDGRAAEKASW